MEENDIKRPYKCIFLGYKLRVQTYLAGKKRSSKEGGGGGGGNDRNPQYISLKFRYKNFSD